MRLDHLLSKELLTTCPVLPHGGAGWLSVLPIAQADVLRWVLMGGISTNHFLAWPSWLCPGASTATKPLSSFWGWGVVVGNVSGVRGVVVVFGALLGPEATGPSRSFCGETRLVFLCFLRLASRRMLNPLVCGVCGGGG